MVHVYVLVCGGGGWAFWTTLRIAPNVFSTVSTMFIDVHVIMQYTCMGGILE